MRLAVYADYSYRVQDGRVSAELPFALFVQGLVPHCERLVVTGRLDPTRGEFPYAVEGVTYVPQPHYESGAHFAAVIKAIPAGAKGFWHLLDGVDVIWILGPNPPQALIFALLALLRGRRVVLGVRQLLPELIRHRRPGNRAVLAAAVVLEQAFRLLGRFVPVVVVGPDLAQRYRRSADLHVLYVSLLHDSDVLDPDAASRAYDGPELRVVSIGRLDPEKNPLLLADILQRLHARDTRWRLDVCGDGSLAGQLAKRLADLGVGDVASMHGYVPIGAGLWDLYRRGHALLHVSLTEGVPQVLLEAFAVGLPAVATAVGGVPDFVDGAGWLIPPNDAAAAADALTELAANDELRRQYVQRASAIVRNYTLESECDRLARFLEEPWRAGSGSAPKGSGSARKRSLITLLRRRSTRT